MRELSMHILDIAENSINAEARRVEIFIGEDMDSDTLTIGVRDDGKGMDLGRKEANPYYTSKECKRFGLGIPLFRQAAEQCDGDFKVEPREGGGTSVTARFRLSHIDLKPMGDVAGTMSTLVAGHPEVDYELLYEKNGYRFKLDTAELRAEIDGLPLNTPEVLIYIKQEVSEGLRRTNG